MRCSNEKIIERFKEGYTNDSSHTGNLYSDGNVCYSYGSHFPLIVRRQPEDNFMRDKEWFLLNGDIYSITTSRHQSLTFREFSEYPRVSFSALSAIGIDYQKCHLVDFENDKYVAIYKNEVSENEWNSFKSTVPIGATYFEREYTQGLRDQYEKSYHLIGTVVLRQENKDYICSIDGRSYFISELPYQVESVSEAYEALIPDEVLNAQNRGIDVKRQGEWFFIPVHDMRVKKADILKWKRLPLKDSRSRNYHITPNRYDKYNSIYVTGNVYHKNKFDNKSSGEHRIIQLGKIWHKAVLNLSVRDVSSDGRVD